VLVSTDNVVFESFEKIELGKEFKEKEANKHTVTTSAEGVEARYIKIIVKNGGKLPTGHENAGRLSWMFMDELDLEVSTEIDKTPRIIYTPSLTRGGSNGNMSLLDGIDGTLTKNHKGEIFSNGQWSGQQNSNLQIDIDLREVKEFVEMSVGFLKEPEMGIYLPGSVKFEVSEDKKTYSEVGVVNIAQDTDSANELFHATVASAAKGRYVRITVTRNGNKEWFFFDEFT
jgi:hypothetical protein